MRCRRVSAKFDVKDSGKRAEFSGGAVRDTEDGKTRYDLVSPHMLRRLAEHMTKGAVKYEPRNWEKGIPTERLVSSALRHFQQWRLGDRSEDHLSAVLFNIGALVHFEEAPGGNPAEKAVPPVVEPEAPKTEPVAGPLYSIRTGENSGFDIVRVDPDGSTYWFGPVSRTWMSMKRGDQLAGIFDLLIDARRVALIEGIPLR